MFRLAADPYNQAEQLKSANTYGLATVTNVYDGAGNIIASTNGRGTTCSQYSAENRLTSTQAPGDAQATTYTYDPAGNVLGVTNASGTISTVYDEAGRPIKTTDATGATETTTYDADGNPLARVATPIAGGASYTTSYSYDTGDELTSQSDPAGNAYSFYYDSRGNLRATQYPNGTLSWTNTNPDGWVTGVYNRHGTLTGSETSVPSDASPIVDYTYLYNQEGQKTKETRSGGGIATRVTQYVYDDLGRLQQVTPAKRHRAAPTASTSTQTARDQRGRKHRRHLHLQPSHDPRRRRAHQRRDRRHNHQVRLHR